MLPQRHHREETRVSPLWDRRKHNNPVMATIRITRRVSLARVANWSVSRCASRFSDAGWGVKGWNEWPIRSSSLMYAPIPSSKGQLAIVAPEKNKINRAKSTSSVGPRNVDWGIVAERFISFISLGFSLFFLFSGNSNNCRQRFFVLHFHSSSISCKFVRATSTSKVRTLKSLLWLNFSNHFTCKSNVRNVKISEYPIRVRCKYALSRSAWRVRPWNYRRELQARPRGNDL